MAKVFSVLFLPLLLSACSYDSPENHSPAPSEIFGNPTYRAISFGGYRGLTREEGPSVAQLIDDVKILDAMGVKLLRTYNTSQFPQVARLLQAIETVKQTDPDFEMYVMLGAWIESKNAWTEAVWDAANNAWVEGTGPDHSEGEHPQNDDENIDHTLCNGTSAPGGARTSHGYLGACV